MYEENKPNLIQTVYKCGIYIIFIIVFLYFSFSSSRFLTARNMVNILQQSAPIGIATTGMVFVLLTAGVDISVGAVMYCCAILAGLMLADGYNPLLAVLVSTLVGAVIGSLNGFVITKWKIVPFITTLAVLGIARGIGLLAGGTRTIFIKSAAKKIATIKVLDFPVVILVMIAVMLIGHFVLSKTVFGRQLYAVGNDPRAAAKIGIPVDRIVFSVYVISGGLAGLAAVISAAQVGSVPISFAVGNEFLAISAAVLGGVSFFGGKGRIIPGAVMGVLLIYVILNGLTMINASPYAYNIFRSVIIFIAVLVDSVNNKGAIR